MADFVRNLNPAAARSNSTNGFFANVPYNLVASGGYAALGGDVTINSTTVSPLWLYRGDEAIAGPTWPPNVGAITLDPSSYGTNPPTVGDPGTYGDGLDYTNPQKSMQTTLAQPTMGVGTDDFIFEIVCKSNNEITYSRNMFWAGSAPATIEVGFFVDAANKMGCSVRYGGTTIYGASSGAAVYGANVDHHQVLAVNRDEASTNGMLVYNNGVLRIQANASALSASSLSGTNAKLFIGGASTSSTYTWNGSIYYVACYKAPSWFAAGATGKTQLDAWVAARYAALIA